VQAASRPAGGSWTAAHQLAHATNSQLDTEQLDNFPQLRTDPNGESVALWDTLTPMSDGSRGPRRLYTAHASSSGTWDAPQVVDTEQGTYGYNQFAPPEGLFAADFAFVAGVDTFVAWDRITYTEPNSYGTPNGETIQATWNSTTTDPDTTNPTVSITTPRDGAHYTQGALVQAGYSCQDEDGGSGVASCQGTVPSGQHIDTASAGVKSFTVNSSDHAGNQAAPAIIQYTVDPAPAPKDTARPTISLHTPRNGAHYKQGSRVSASYSCHDNTGGSGIATCKGTIANDQSINTAHAGRHSFSVTARDHAGNITTRIIHYTVNPKPKNHKHH
jgi:hypothetical protein